MSATSSVQELFNNAANKVVAFGEAKTPRLLGEVRETLQNRMFGKSLAT
jgi:hypothetical protein